MNLSELFLRILTGITGKRQELSAATSTSTLHTLAFLLEDASADLPSSADDDDDDDDLGNEENSCIDENGWIRYMEIVFCIVSQNVTF